MGRAFMNRIFPSTTLLVSALSLTACFNNMSGLESESTKKSSQSNSVLNDSGFSNETGTIDMEGVLIGTYRDASSASDFGILIDLQRSLVTTLGATSVQTILDGIDANTAMQAREVVIHLPDFNIKATTTLGKLAAGNNKKLRNVMNIRPRLVRVDLTTSALEIPSSPSLLQLKNSNKTVITYGGRIEGDFVRRMTVLIPFAGVNAGFLPSVSIPTYGDGFPFAAPEELVGSVKLTRVTTAIATLFNKMMSNPPYGPGVLSGVPYDAIKTITQTKDSLALSVHYKIDPSTGLPMTYPALSTAPEYFANVVGLPMIDSAYFININPGNNAGPEIFPFCHSGYNSQDQTAGYGTAGNEVDFSHPLACACSAAVPYYPGTDRTPPTATQFADTCPSAAADQRAALLATAVAATPAVAPTTITLPTPRTVNDIVLSQE